MSTSSASKRFTPWRWSLVALLVLALIVVPFIFLEALFNQQIQHWQSDLSQAPAIFALIAGALALDVFLPIPSSVVNTWAGAELGFVQGTLAAWIGLSLGSWVAYDTANRLGSRALLRFVGEAQYRRAQDLNRRYGLLALALMRPVPVLAEASMFWAGMAGIARRRFWLIVLPANLGIAATYASVGAYAANWDAFLVAFVFALLLPGITMLVARKALPAGEARADDGQQCLRIDYKYPVVHTRDVFAPDNPSLLKAIQSDGKVQRVCVCVDQGVLNTRSHLAQRIHSYFTRHAHSLQFAGELVSIPGGEKGKSDPELLQHLYRQFQSQGIDRHSYVLAIGGGAVLDVVGYAAATAHRGIRLIRMPTTVLAQNDAGVGVKNGINWGGRKNYLGCFAPPYAVINDGDFLATLGPRDRRAGMAEAVKVALIRDADFFHWLEARADALSRFIPDAVESLIARCAALHLRQITGGGDPFERGSRRPLDFGHWAAHRLESLSGFELRHGEAVAIGIALDSRYSVLAGHLAEGVDERVFILLHRLGFTLWHPALLQDDGRKLLHGLEEFRQHLGGELSIALLSDIGHEFTVHHMDQDKVLAAVDWLEQRQGIA